jgi:hypothetical protein
LALILKCLESNGEKKWATTQIWNQARQLRLKD